MANLSNSDKIAKKSLYDIGYEYLCDNFHKFNEANKIKIAISMLSIFNKDGSKSQNDMKQIVVMGEIKKSNGEPLRYKIGNPDSPEPLRHSEETSPTS